MDWRTLSYLKKRKLPEINIEEIKFYGKTKEEVKELLADHFKFEGGEDMWYFIISETWYGKRKTIKLVFEKNKVEEKYIKTEYGKLLITKLYKNLSGHY